MRVLRRRLAGNVETIGQVIKIGVPAAFSDLYYTLLEMRWPSFFFLAALTFFVVNVVFGAVYAALPGAVSNAQRGSIIDGFLFSVDTLGTVGYGQMAPATRTGHAVAACEVFVGLFFSATMTGLIFSRFAKPRRCLLFGNVAVLGEYAGRRTLKIRLAPIRLHTLADARAQLTLRRWEKLHDGRVLQRLTPLELHNHHNPMLALTWTLGHFADGDSPLAAALDGDEDFALIVLVSGFDLTLASQSFGSKLYRPSQILREHEFVDMVSYDTDLTIVDIEEIGSVRRKQGLEARED